jgi:aryl-alcohol dehydrogenase-like predicted oxidoreductase
MDELGVEAQRAAIRRALDLGINWFDTAAGYGDGKSEESLGTAFSHLGLPSGVHIATKVRLLPEHLADVRGRVHASLADSLARLKVPGVTLLQLHNAVTAVRGDEPTSVTPADVLGRGGILEAFRELQANGLVRYLGLTGVGQARPLREVVASGAFDTIQTPYSLLNPSAGRDMPSDFPESNYGNVIDAAARQGMGVFAIRVFAGGALLGKPPSAYTHRTLFFPLAPYERDARRTRTLAARLPPGQSLQAAAVRFVLDDPRVAAAIVGFREPEQLNEAVAALNALPLSASLLSAALAEARSAAPNANPAF